MAAREAHGAADPAAAPARAFFSVPRAAPQGGGSGGRGCGVPSPLTTRRVPGPRPPPPPPAYTARVPIGDTSYEIARPTGVCAGTGATIAPGEPLVAVLLEGPGGEGGEGGDERLQRRDYTPAAWESGPGSCVLSPESARGEAGGKIDGLRVLGFWRGVMPEPGESKRRFIDDRALTDLFEQLGEGGEGGGEPDHLSPKRAAFRYVLALILVRKRLLRLEPGGGGGPGGGPGLLVRWPKAPPEQEPIHVPDPGMTEEAVADAIEQLGGVISAGGSQESGVRSQE